MKPADNQRTYERIKYLADVELGINANTYHAELKDISLGGAFISMSTIPRIDYADDVAITIPFAYHQKEVRLKANVVRYAKEGLGVLFF
jgi:hypothetical protein